jgi:hypothetical protein
MELRNYIELGAEKAGSLTALGKMLDMSQPTISSAKAHKRPMPIDAVVKLADYIDADLKALIAANELVTEKKEEKRAYWRPFVEHVRATSIAGLAICATLGSAGVEAFQRNEVRIATNLENLAGCARIEPMNNGRKIMASVVFPEPACASRDDAARHTRTTAPGCAGAWLPTAP